MYQQPKEANRNVTKVRWILNWCPATEGVRGMHGWMHYGWMDGKRKGSKAVDWRIRQYKKRLGKMKERKMEFVFCWYRTKNGSNKRLSLVLVGPFHQCSTTPIASTQYLIRVNEFRRKGKATEYRWSTTRNKGRESFYYSLFMNLIGGM